MPIYDFLCKKCEHCFSASLKMNNRALPLDGPCPNCGGEKCIMSILSAPAVVSPFSIDGLRQPKADFKERMQQIKTGQHGMTKIKDY